jgi:hypothetical protein
MIGGGGITWSPGAGKYINHIAWEFGAFPVPNVGGSVTYNWEIFDLAYLFEH